MSDIIPSVVTIAFKKNECLSKEKKGKVSLSQLGPTVLPVLSTCTHIDGWAPGRWGQIGDQVKIFALYEHWKTDDAYLLKGKRERRAFSEC